MAGKIEKIVFDGHEYEITDDMTSEEISNLFNRDDVKIKGSVFTCFLIDSVTGKEFELASRVISSKFTKEGK